MRDGTVLVESDGPNSTLSPVVCEDIALSINTQYNDSYFNERISCQNATYNYCLGLIRYLIEVIELHRFGKTFIFVEASLLYSLQSLDSVVIRPQGLNKEIHSFLSDGLYIVEFIWLIQGV